MTSNTKTMKRRFSKQLSKYSNPRTAQKKAYKYLGKTAKIYPSNNPQKKYKIYDPKNEKWVKAEQNCRLNADHDHKIVRIRSIKTIPRFTELFLEYGEEFVFPCGFEKDF